MGVGGGGGVLEAKKGGKCQWKREWGPHRSNLVEGEEGRNKRAGDVRRKKAAASQKQKSQLLESCSKQLVPKTEREDKVGSVWTGAGPEPKPEQGRREDHYITQRRRWGWWGAALLTP